MYYSEFRRVKRMEKVLEGLAYASILIDTLVAVATLIFMHGIGGSAASNTLLVFSDYLVFFEVIFAAVLFSVLMVLKHSKNLFLGMGDLVFKTKYSKVFDTSK